MDHTVVSYEICSISQVQICQFRERNSCEFSRNLLNPVRVASLAVSNAAPSHRKMPKNLRYPRRTKVPADLGINRILKKKNTDRDPFPTALNCEERVESSNNNGSVVIENDSLWSPDEIEVISSLFQGRIPQKPGKLTRERPLPLPMPYKLRPLGLPAPKKYVKLASRSSLCARVYKNPNFLIDLAREIRSLPTEKNASAVLNKYLRFLRKGSLSLTIRELGHMGLPERALETFCWAEKHPQLFPDDRILASTVEILARTKGLKMPLELEKFTSSANRSVIEAMARGFIRVGSLNLARKLLLLAKDRKRTLDPSIHAKLILELGKNPDKYKLASALLDELGEREDLKLKPQDCTAIMKVCIKLGKFQIVESLFNWFKESGQNPSVVMYTTIIYSRYRDKKYREAMVVVWEMEELNCLLDLPAYRVVIRLCVALNDLSRTVRYFSRLKEAGFSPTYDIYRDLIKIYTIFGRLAKCKQISKEAEMAGFKLDKETASLLLQIM